MSNGNGNSKLQLPAALITKPLPSISTMNVDTNILDPLIVNNTFARFVLEKKGILDAGSTFTFALTCDPAADANNNAFLPLRTGINALIQQAVLKVGTKVLATSDQYAHYETMRRQFKTAEEKALKDAVKLGTTDNLEPDNAGDGLYQVAGGVFPSSATTETASQVDPAIAIKSDPTTTPVFQVKLSDLFPMARNLQLPLFIINEQVSVEFTFRRQSAHPHRGNVVCFGSNGGAYAGSVNVDVSPVNVQFLADYLTYDDATMEETAKMVMSETGMVLPYEDLLLTTATIPAGAGGAAPTQQSITSEIAVANRSVRSILLHQSTEAESRLLGRGYASPANNVPESYNIRVNDSLVYSRPIQREAQKYNQLSQVFNADLNVNVAEYSLDPLTDKQSANGDNAVNNNILSTNTYQGHSARDLQGQQHFVGVDMSTSPFNITGTGTAIGQKPIQFQINYFNSAINNPARTLRYYSLVERQFTLKNGVVFVSA